MSQSSKLHIYLWLMQKSSAYHRLSNEFCGICSHQLKSARKQRLNLNKKDYQSIYYCCPKQQRLFAVCTNKNPKTQSQLPVFITDEHGLKKLKCSSVQILWVAHRIIELYLVMLKQKILLSHLSSSVRLDRQIQSFLFSWESKWLPCDKGL